MNVLKYAAGKYPTNQQSKAPYQDLYNTMKASKSDASIMRVTVDPNNVEGETLVVLIGTYFDTTLQAKIDTYFTEDIATHLPDALLNRLWARRENRIQDAKKIPGTNTYKFEAHNTRIDEFGKEVPITPEGLISLAKNKMVQNATKEAVERTRAKEPTILHVDNAQEAMKAFDAIVAPNPTGTPSPLPVGSKVKMQTIPFIRGYQALHQQTTTDDVIKRVNQEYGRVPDNATRAITIIGDIENTVLKASTKYRFTPSAITLLNGVFEPTKTDFIRPDNHIWIELDTPISTPYGENIRAIYAYNAYPLTEINRVIPETKDKHLHDVVLKSFVPHLTHWSLDVIGVRTNTIFDFTYDTLAKCAIFLGSHMCPYNQCKYIQEANLVEAVCLPCDTCKAAIVYWFSWLYYALKIINGDYAVTPETPTFQVEPMEYQQEETIIVGKGKNQRRIKATKTRHIDYYVVKFDASIKQPARTPASKEEKLAASHPSWLVTTDRGDVIWVRKRIAEYKRHYPTGYATQHTETELVTVRSHPKYIPMLKPEKRKADKITKIVASQYEGEAGHE